MYPVRSDIFSKSICIYLNQYSKLCVYMCVCACVHVRACVYVCVCELCELCLISEYIQYPHTQCQPVHLHEYVKVHTHVFSCESDCCAEC